MFSIIIPLYNKAPYIEKTIRSVLAQTCKEFELIVVDDGSTDDSLNNAQFIIHNSELENPKLQSRIKLVSQENQGVSMARNNGVKLAKYDYIAFLDADDWWAPTYLEEMKGLIEQYAEAGIYGSSYFVNRNNIRRLPRNGVEKDFCGYINYFRSYAVGGEMPLWTGATIIQKQIFKSEDGFKPTLKFGEDFDLWVRLALKYPVAFLNKPLAYYNQDVEQMNRAIGDKFYKPEEHMLFTDYGELNRNPDFVKLFEALAVYGLLPYYLAGINKPQVAAILQGIHWKNHAFKYNLYYRFLPRMMVRCWFLFNKFAYQLKKKIIY